MTKPTPGPWKTNSNQSKVTDEHGCFIADIFPVTLKYGSDLDMLRANARLIAAAPDLLEVANLALECIGYDPDFEDTAEKLRAAIGKAEGIAATEKK